MTGSRANRGAMGARTCAIAALSALLWGIAAATAPASAETLRDALAAAYKFNPRLDAERARLRATDEEVARAKSGYRPTITGSADIGYQRTDTKTPAGSGGGETHPKGYGVTGTQPIFSGFRTVNAVRAAEATVRAGRENLRIVEQSVLLEAVTAYVDVVRDQAIVRLRENNVNVLTRELRATQDRFSVGEVTRTDVAQAEARRAGAVSALDLARANLKTSRATFERVVGHPPSNLVEPGPPRGLPSSVNEATAIGSKEAPAVVAALYLEQAARHTVDLVWGELLPTVQLEADYNRRFDPSVSIDETESTTVTGRVVVPIYEGGEVRARVRQAKQTHVARLQEIEQARTENQALAVSAWSQLVAARAAVESDQVQVNANRTALTGVREEERVGQRTLLDVLNAEQELLNAEVQLATDRRNSIVAAYGVFVAIGRLSAADQSLTAQVYDPEVHYHEVRRKWFGISITRPDGSKEQHDVWPAQVEPEPPAKASSKPKK